MGLAALLLSAPAFAQAVWVPLTPNSQPGQPAEVVLDRAFSTPETSAFDIRIHGFWREAKVWSGTTYQRLRVPGLDFIGQPGAPDLQTVRLRIAVANNSSRIDVHVVPMAPTQSFTGLTVEPRPVPEMDGETIDPTRDPGPGRTNGSPERFQIDRGIYSSAGIWPAEMAPSSVPVAERFGGMPMGKVTVSPLSCDLVRGIVYATPHVRVFTVTNGAALHLKPKTPESAAMCEQLFHNWPAVSGSFAVDTTTYTGRYLIVTPASYVAAIQEFADYRRACGFGVTVMTTEETGAGCANIRAAIDAWYSATPFEYDHYCLLVGDTEAIPLCDVPGVPGLQTDDLYGSPGDGDLHEEVFVGRISADDAAGVQSILQKIIQYETNPILGGDYDEVLLVAHEQGSPGKYEGAQEAVANASYQVPPTFLKRYGSSAASTNASVQAAINAQVGLVCYRGHGSTATWSGWNIAGESFHKNEVVGLANALQPVVWSFSCTNNNLSAYAGTEVDSIGEVWLEQPFAGVAHYGALTVSGTTQNHLLDAEMFRAVYDLGLTTHAQAIYLAEELLYATYPDGLNSWHYNLLGCPAMKIRRTVPQPLALLAPQEIAIGRSSVRFEVRDPRGFPVAGALVSAWKPGVGGDDVFVNGYTGPNGDVFLAFDPQFRGGVFVAARDFEGNVVTTEIPVHDDVWTDLGGGTRGSFGVPVLRGSGSLRTGEPMELILSQAAPNAPALLFASLSDLRIPFAGGILHTSYDALVLPLLTDASGVARIGVASWPGSASGTVYYFDEFSLDSGAQSAVALSNGLRAINP